MQQRPFLQDNALQDSTEREGQQGMKEYWDLYDAAGRLTGETILRGELLPEGRYHKVVHIWIQNPKGKLLLQKRSDTVGWKPGFWGVTGGSVVAGEAPAAAAVRETGEELGIRALPEQLEFLFSMRRRDTFCYIYLLKADVSVEELTLQEEEVALAKWLTMEEIKKDMEEGRLHRYDYFEVLCKYLGL